ncbi:PIN domain-containing protein [Thermus sp.]|uniref:PIN domain-containing protein n=1 Tax=Thermus sp. TaxID=275 RepID=UPI00307E1638
MGYRFLEDLEAGFFTGYWDRGILPEARRLALRYQNLPLGFSDAYVAATALAWKAPVLTLDAHFLVLAGRVRNYV